MEDRDERFDSDRAELFEALGHPNRIRILQALQAQPLGFAELKKRVGIGSSGHLTFHLGKLGRLLSLGPDGRYFLTEDGREAVRMVDAAKETGGGSAPKKRVEVPRALLAGVVVLLLLLGAVVAVQQMRIAQLSTQPSGATMLAGRSFWSVSFPLNSLPWDRNVSLDFHGVRFTLIPGQSGQSVVGVVMLGAGDTANITVNGSMVNLTTISYGTFFISPNQNVKVTFPDGAEELMRLTWTAYDNATMIFYPAHQAFPWLSHHTGPQAAVVEANGVITLYVSAGS